jgi:Tfp pilus assembly protein PilF
LKPPHRKSKEIKLQFQQSDNPPLFRLFKRDFVLGFFLFIITFAVYQPAWNGKPIWDDDAHITKPELRSLNGFVRIWVQFGATQQYYPLVHSVFWLEYYLWGDSTLGYHLVNILLHFISALFLVCVMRRLAIPGAWFIAAVFTLHPVQVESVAWITELKNTLSGIFFLSSVLLYLLFDRERKKSFYAISIGLFILGLMSKSVIATMPVSLLAVIWWKRGKINWKNDIVPLLPFFVVGIAYGLFTAWVERKFIGAQGGEFTFTLIERCLIAGRATWFYLGKIFLPVNLIFIYPRWNVSQAVWWQYLFPLITLILAGVFWTLRNHLRAPLAGLICFTASLFPALGFFNIYPFRYSFVADHFQYLACIVPIALLVGTESTFGLLKSKIKLLFCAIVLLILSILTWEQSAMYSNAETLYRTTIRKNPNCWMADVHLGMILEKTGKTDEVISYYRKALDINPNSTEGHNNLGNVLFQIGRTDEALFHYQKALEINPNYKEAHNNLGILLAKTGYTDEAIDHFRKVLEINPNEINTLQNLSFALIQKEKFADAIPFFQKALVLAKVSGDESMIKEITANLERLNKMIRSAPQGSRQN